MGSDVLANKYRPKVLPDVIGQDHVVRILTNTIESGKFHNGYILSGQFGTGKTTVARAFAAAINNPAGPSIKPDLNSPVVQNILEGKSLDVREIDAASQTGIENIRDLKNSLSYAPVECRHKIVILDEAHRLSGQAADAALKMIEEPPPGVIFILCTTDEKKLKDTIHSRCISLRFSKVAWNLLQDHLEKVADKEGIKYEEGALKIAARLSKGSVREALQNLQMLHAFSAGNTITKEIAEQALETFDDGLLFDLVDAIVKPDAGDAMRVVDQLLGGGRDIGTVLGALVEHLRILMVLKTCKDSSGFVYLSESERKRYDIQKSVVHLQLIIKMMQLVADMNRAISMNISPQTILEMFVVQSIIENAHLKTSK